MYCENFEKFHRRKFQKITNEAIKTAKTQNLNIDDSKTLFHHCLILHLISLRGLGENTNAKQLAKIKAILKLLWPLLIVNFSIPGLN